MSNTHRPNIEEIIQTSGGDRSGNILNALQAELPLEQLALLGLADACQPPIIHMPILHGPSFDIEKANQLIRKLKADKQSLNAGSTVALQNAIAPQQIMLGENYIIQMIYRDHADQVKALLAFGLDFSVVKEGSTQNTALHAAIYLKKLEIFYALLGSYVANPFISEEEVRQCLVRKNAGGSSVLNLAANRINAAPGVNTERLALGVSKNLFIRLVSMLLPTHYQEVVEAIDSICHQHSKQEIQKHFEHAIAEAKSTSVFDDSVLLEVGKHNKKNQKRKERRKLNKAAMLSPTQEDDEAKALGDPVEKANAVSEKNKEENQVEEEIESVRLVLADQVDTTSQVSSSLMMLGGAGKNKQKKKAVKIDVIDLKVPNDAAEENKTFFPKIDSRVVEGCKKTGNEKTDSEVLSNDSQQIAGLHADTNYSVNQINGSVDEQHYDVADAGEFQEVSRKKKTNPHKPTVYQQKDKIRKDAEHAKHSNANLRNGYAGTNSHHKKTAAEEQADDGKPVGKTPVTHTVAPWAHLIKTRVEQAKEVIVNSPDNNLESKVAEEQLTVSSQLPDYMRGTLISYETAKEMRKLQEKGIETGINHYTDSGQGFFTLRECPELTRREERKLVVDKKMCV